VSHQATGGGDTLAVGDLLDSHAVSYGKMQLVISAVHDGFGFGDGASISVRMDGLQMARQC